MSVNLQRSDCTKQVSYKLLHLSFTFKRMIKDLKLNACVWYADANTPSLIMHVIELIDMVKCYCTIVQWSKTFFWRQNMSSFWHTVPANVSPIIVSFCTGRTRQLAVHTVKYPLMPFPSVFKEKREANSWRFSQRAACREKGRYWWQMEHRCVDHNNHRLFWDECRN